MSKLVGHWPSPRPATLGHIGMFSFSALVAGSFSLGAMAAPFVSPAALTVLRFALAGVLVGALAARSGGLTRRAFAAPWRYGVMGALMAVYFVTMFTGLQTTSAVPIAAVFTLTPVMAAGFGWLLLRQTTTPRMALALGIGAAGALWVIFRGDFGALLRLDIGAGEAIFFAGCVAHAIYTPLLRKLNRGEPALVSTFGMMMGGLVILTLWGGRDVLATDWAALPAIVWICLIYISVAASAVTFVLMQFCAMRLPSAKVMAYTYLVPTWVIMWELALGHAVPPWNVLGGVGLTVLALGLLLKEEGGLGGGSLRKLP
jgi:drug/metabolite transporter (DMT)-like permease